MLAVSTSADPFVALAKMLPDEFSQTLLAGAAASLCSDNPVRGHNFAATLRELIGHLLHKLAPDELVTKAPWYKTEADKPTRRQRATFAVQGGMSDKMVESLGLDITDMRNALIGAVDELSKYTHVRADTLLSDQQQIEEFATRAGLAVLEFFRTIEDFRTVLADTALGALGTDIFEKFIESSVDDLDILSTHTQVQSVDVETVDISSIGLAVIQYKVEGMVNVQLVWGSGSDHDRGEGATHSDSFPFSCTVEGSVEKLSEFTHVTLPEVDTSSWFE